MKKKGPKIVITPEQHERIKQVYLSTAGRGGVNALVEELGLPRWKITYHAIMHGFVLPRLRGPKWTAEEMHYLKKFAHLAPDTIQRRLKELGFKRTISAIVVKRKRMMCPQYVVGYSGRELARLLGVNVNFVCRAIAGGELRAERRGTMRTQAQGGDQWRIMPDDVRDFIINNVAAIDFRRLDKYWLVDLLAGAGFHCSTLGRTVTDRECRERFRRAVLAQSGPCFSCERAKTLITGKEAA